MSGGFFKHVTNDEIHTPKSIVVTQPEFKIYQEFRSKEMQDLHELIIEQSTYQREGLNKIETLITHHIEATTPKGN